MKRTIPMQTFTDDLTKRIYGKSNTDALSTDTCLSCNKAVTEKSEFKNERSRREYTISGLCQTCQDEVFNSKEEDEEG